mmetsp:Transcript_6201/g.17308  ORF Transcript_6201/g.17308 Transcript_6201/m.17308 type:complete len:336 (+) Transcript_6201:283-1290(+)
MRRRARWLTFIIAMYTYFSLKRIYTTLNMYRNSRAQALRSFVCGDHEPSGGWPRRRAGRSILPRQLRLLHEVERVDGGIKLFAIASEDAVVLRLRLHPEGARGAPVDGPREVAAHAFGLGAAAVRRQLQRAGLGEFHGLAGVQHLLREGGAVGGDLADGAARALDLPARLVDANGVLVVVRHAEAEEEEVGGRVRKDLRRGRLERLEEVCDPPARLVCVLQGQVLGAPEELLLQVDRARVHLHGLGLALGARAHSDGALAELLVQRRRQRLALHGRRPALHRGVGGRLGVPVLAERQGALREALEPAVQARGGLLRLRLRPRGNGGLRLHVRSPP